MVDEFALEQQRLARNHVFSGINAVDARLQILLNRLFALIREFTNHPHGGDPRGIEAKHEYELKAKNAKLTETAFIVAAAITGGIFVWFAIETNYPPVLVLMLVIALFLGFSWAITVALRQGAIWALDVQIYEDREKTDTAERRARHAFTFCLAAFIVSLTCSILARNMVIGGPEFLGVSQTLTEISALLCAAIAGAKQNFYNSIVSLVAKIHKTMQEVSVLRAQKLALGGDVDQVDRLLEATTAAHKSDAPPTLPAAEIQPTV
jgi:hypothetical protein